MCGIFAFQSFNNHVLSDTQLQDALQALNHRGPDDQGIWYSSNRTTVLAHTRLAIMDLAGGHQPIHNEDRTISVIVNGEFYDYARLRGEAESRGHIFSSSSDSELLCHLYEDYGIDCLHHLEGEFAFILWDSSTETLFCARDRFGVKPLYWSQQEDALAVASEEGALFACGIPAQWDRDAFTAACTIQYVPDSDSLYAGVYSVQPAHYLLVDTSGTVQEEQYWSFPQVPRQLDDFSNSCECVSTALEQAIKKRLQSDVPICAQLSGGIDSCAVAALASKLLGSPLDCFTVSFDHALYDECEDARACAEFIGARHHVISVQHRDLIDSFKDAVIAGGGVAINGHISAKYLLSRHIQEQGYKVVLTGEGSDEILLGYPHLRQDYQSSTQMQEIHAENEASQGLMVASVEVPEGLRAALKSFESIPNFIIAKYRFGERLKTLMHEDVANSFNFSLESYLERYRIQLPSYHEHAPVRQSAYLWSRMALGTYILRTLGDRMEMAHSVEGRLPFLDHRFVETVQTIPVAHLMKDGIEKHPLRVILKGIIPEQIRNKRKHPFLAPPMFCSPEPFVLDYLHDVFEANLEQQLPFFNRNRLLDCLKRIPVMSEEERRYWDPVLTFLVSAIHLNKEYGL